MMCIMSILEFNSRQGSGNTAAHNLCQMCTQFCGQALAVHAQRGVVTECDMARCGS